MICMHPKTPTGSTSMQSLFSFYIEASAEKLLKKHQIFYSKKENGVHSVLTMLSRSTRSQVQQSASTSHSGSQLKVPPQKKRMGRITGYIAYAEEQCHNYKRQLADVEALLARDVMPVLQRVKNAYDSDLTHSNGHTVSGEQLSGHMHGISLMKNMRELLGDLTTLTDKSMTVITSLQQDAKSIASASSSSSYSSFQSSRGADGVDDVNDGEEEEKKRAYPLCRHLATIGDLLEEHLHLGNAIDPAKLQALIHEVDELSSVSLPTVYSEAVIDAVVKEERKAMEIAMRKALVTAAGSNVSAGQVGSLSTPTGSAAANIRAQLVGEVANNNKTLEALRQQITAVENNISVLSSDEARLEQELALIAAAESSVRDQTEERLTKLDREAREAVEEIEKTASRRIENERRRREHEWELDAEWLREEERLALDYDRTEFVLHEEINALRAELEAIESSIRYAAQN